MVTNLGLKRRSITERVHEVAIAYLSFWYLPKCKGGTKITLVDKKYKISGKLIYST